jgi:hypothetical protein
LCKVGLALSFSVKGDTSGGGSGGGDSFEGVVFSLGAERIGGGDVGLVACRDMGQGLRAQG